MYAGKSTPCTVFGLRADRIADNVGFVVVVVVSVPSHPSPLPGAAQHQQPATTTRHHRRSSHTKHPIRDILPEHSVKAMAILLIIPFIEKYTHSTQPVFPRLALPLHMRAE